MEKQKKIPPKLVIIKGEEEFEVRKILNKRVIREKEKFLVKWKGYIAEEDYYKWSLTICNGYFDTLKSSKM